MTSASTSKRSRPLEPLSRDHATLPASTSKVAALPARPSRHKTGMPIMSVVVELAGLEIPGRHGVEDWERETEQPFVYDLELELAEPAADRIEKTVDYREVVELVRAVSAGMQFRLLESMADAVAGALLERFPIERARVRVRKPRVQLGASIDYTAATAERS